MEVIERCLVFKISPFGMLECLTVIAASLNDFHITYRKIVAVYEEGGPDSVLLEAVQHLGCAGLGPVVKSQVNCNIILRLN